MTLGSRPCAGTSSLVSVPLSSPTAVPSPSSSQRMVLNHRSDHVSSLLKCRTGFPPSHSEETPESLGSPASHPHSLPSHVPLPGHPDLLCPLPAGTPPPMALTLILAFLQMSPSHWGLLWPPCFFLFYISNFHLLLYGTYNTGPPLRCFKGKSWTFLCFICISNR